MVRAELPQNNRELRGQYFQEKKIEFETACAEGAKNSHTACFSLGEWHQLVAKDVKKAANIYERNCFQNGHSNSCFNLARLYFSKHKDRESIFHASEQRALKELPSNRDRAMFLYKKACYAKSANETNNKQSCTAFATIKLFEDNISSAEIDESLNLLEASCKDNESEACFKAGGVYLRPGKRLERAKAPKSLKDSAKAFQLLNKGCELLHANSCQVLAVMYKNGDGVEKSEEKFKHYKELTIDIVGRTNQKLGVTVL